MDRVVTGRRPERDRTAELARRTEFRRRKAAGRVRFAAQLAENLQDAASSLRRTISAIQSSGLAVDVAVLQALLACADDIETSVEVVAASAARSAA